MAKITIDDIAAQFASTNSINLRFQQIEDELNNKVFYRDNPLGETNFLSNDLDMNLNDILNGGVIHTNRFILDGNEVVADTPLVNSSFILLPDTPSAYTGEDGKIVAVNAAEDAVEFIKAPAQKNHIINPSMQHWQRGTPGFTGNVYTADRWRISGVSTNATVDRATLSVADTVTYGTQYALQLTRAATSVATMSTRLENVAELIDRDMVFSMVALGPSGTATITAVAVSAALGTGTPVSSAPVALSSTLSRKEYPLPQISSSDFQDAADINDPDSYIAYTIDFSVNTGTFQFTNVKVEEGTKATPFEVPEIGEELVKCQRYYQTQTINAFNSLGLARGGLSNLADVDPTLFPTTMRTTPTMGGTVADGTITLLTGGVATSTTNIDVSAIAIGIDNFRFRADDAAIVNGEWYALSCGATAFVWTADAEI